MSQIETQEEILTNDGASASIPRRPRVQLTPEQQELAASHMPMARSLAKMAKQFWPRFIEDFDSAACFALVEAAQVFDPDRKVKFATFARFRVIGALRDIQRRLVNEGYQRELPNVYRSFRYIPGYDERNWLMLTCPDAQVDDVVASREEVEYWLRMLPARHAEACREIYIRDKSQSQAAQALGCAKSRISCLHAEAIQILRESSRIQNAAIDFGFDITRN